MSPRRIEFIVYLVGLMPLAFFQASARAAIGHDGVAFGAVIAYLLGVRFLGRELARLLGRSEEEGS